MVCALQDLLVISTPAKLFQIDTVQKYRVQLKGDLSSVASPLPSPLASPNVAVLRLQYFEPVEARIEPDWEENEQTR